ncbi:MAG: ATP-binding protein [Balneola sp.]
MDIQNNSFITGDGLLYKGVLRDVSKSNESLTPIYEAFTNAIEAIKIKALNDSDYKGEIDVDIYSDKKTDESFDFNKIIIKDNGIGFNESEFKRFNTFKDFTKGFKNLGSGRLQFAHFFEITNIFSVYKASNGKFFERTFSVSKSKNYLSNNAVVFHKSNIETDKESSGSKLIFTGLIDKSSNKYNSLDDVALKEQLKNKYIQYFCINRESMPKITIKHYISGNLSNTSLLTSNDIPQIDKTKELKVNYSILSEDGNKIVKSEKDTTLKLNTFKIPKSELKENLISFTSKDELVDSTDLDLKYLSKNDSINNQRFMFLISGEFIDSKDSNTRGKLDIPSREDFFKSGNIFSTEEVLLEDIQEEVDVEISNLYPEIKEKKKEHELDLEKLKEMFLLSEENDDLDFSINDSEKKILEKFYSKEAKKTAEIDANIKSRIDKLNRLDTSSDEYQIELEKEIQELVKVIPLQNKNDLTHYVARRKIVLELFNKIIDSQLDIQTKEGRNINEKLLHNLIFQQSSSSPEKSDLWLINEDFIYFDGTSEQKLDQVEINGKKLLKKELSNEEEEFRKSLGEDRYSKRPDVLLFPEESKCILLEFKNPDVSVSDHLMQINNYATLIKNYCSNEFNFEIFYGYLIGEKIDSNDVRSHDADFIPSYHYEFLFRTNKTVAGLFGNSDGFLYTEVLKYSSLLERAKRRNEIFIQKLVNS